MTVATHGYVATLFHIEQRVKFTSVSIRNTLANIGQRWRPCYTTPSEDEP